MNNLPSCDQLASYSDYITGDFDWTKEDDPCEGCEAKDTSECCGAPIKFHDICSRCGEHCGSMCDDCEDECEHKNQ